MSNSYVVQSNGVKSVVFSEYVERAVKRLFETQVIDQLKDHPSLDLDIHNQLDFNIYHREDFNMYRLERNKSEVLFTYDREKDRYYVYVFLMEATLSHDKYTIGYQIFRGRDPLQGLTLEREQDPMILVKDGFVESSIYKVANILMANIKDAIRDDEKQ